MERLSRVACYFRWMRGAPTSTNSSTSTTTSTSTSTSSAAVAAADDGLLFSRSLSVGRRRTMTAGNDNDVDNNGDESYERAVRSTSSSSSSVSDYHDVPTEFDVSRRFTRIFESILLWENSVNSISVVIVFNILFWGIIVLEIRGFAAASSAALVVVLCYSTLEAQAQRDGRTADTTASHAKAEQIEEIGRRLKSTVQSLKQLRKDEPGTFCVAACSVSLGLWIIGHTVNGILLAYVICMSILLGPALLLKLTGKAMHHKEWDSEIEEFLPAVTEDSLQVLQRAGESGDHSPTPTSPVSDAQNDFFNEDDLVGLRMPSHEDGSTDGVELSELEFSAGDTDIDGIKFQSGQFEKGSSSEEEAELEPISRKMLSHADESDSEFEIIDSREVANLNVA